MKWRVKLYELDAQGAWLDRGVCDAECKIIRSIGGPSLIAHREQSDTIALKSKITPDGVYERQGDNIIMWRDCTMYGETDYALSFQELDGCVQIWDTIQIVQQKLIQHMEYGNSLHFDMDVLPEEEGRESDGSGGISQGENEFTPFGGSIEAYYVLPTVVSKDNLVLFKERLLNIHPAQKDFVSAQIIQDDYTCIRQLLAFEKILVEENDIPTLGQLAEVVRLILFDNTPDIIEFVLSSDEVFFALASILEYDPLLRERGQYRIWLSSAAALPKEIVSLDIAGPKVREMCISYYRMKYLRDVMLHPTIDESFGVTALNSLLAFTATDICTEIYHSTDFLNSIYDVCLGLRTRPPPSHSLSHYPSTCTTGTEIGNDMPSNEEPSAVNPAPSKPVDGYKFLRDLFFLSRSVVNEKRCDLYVELFTNTKDRFMEILMLPLNRSITRLTVAGNDLSREEETMCARYAAEVLSVFAHMCPSVIRRFILEGAVPSINPLSHSTATVASSIFCSSDSHSQPGTSFHIGTFMVDSSISIADSRCTSWQYSRAGQQCNKSALFILLRELVEGRDADSIEHIGEVLKLLVDPQRMDKSEKEKFLAHFYDYYIGWMLLPFLHDGALNRPVANAYYEKIGLLVHSSTSCTQSNSSHMCEKLSSFGLNSSRRTIFELMILCVQQHSYRMKYFALKNNTIGKLIVKSMESKQIGLQIYAVKFIRSIIGKNDEFYYRHIVKLDILKPLFSFFDTVAKRDTLFTSGMFELIDYIRMENIQVLIVYVVEKYSKCFEEVTHVDVYERLHERYEQIIHHEGGEDVTHVAAGGAATGVSSTGSASRATGVSSQLVTSTGSSRRADPRNRKFLEHDSEEDYFFRQGDDDDEDDCYGDEKLRSADHLGKNKDNADDGGDDDDDGDEVIGPKPFREPEDFDNFPSKSSRAVKDVSMRRHSTISNGSDSFLTIAGCSPGGVASSHSPRPSPMNINARPVRSAGTGGIAPIITEVGHISNAPSNYFKFGFSIDNPQTVSSSSGGPPHGGATVSAALGDNEHESALAATSNRSLLFHGTPPLIPATTLPAVQFPSITRRHDPSSPTRSCNDRCTNGNGNGSGVGNQSALDALLHQYGEPNEDDDDQSNNNTNPMMKAGRSAADKISTTTTTTTTETETETSGAGAGAVNDAEQHAPLPPLRPKFESGDEDDQITFPFKRTGTKKHNANTKASITESVSSLITGSASDNNFPEGVAHEPSNRHERHADNGSPKEEALGHRGIISFAVKKKVRLA